MPLILYDISYSVTRKFKLNWKCSKSKNLKYIYRIKFAFCIFLVTSVSMKRNKFVQFEWMRWKWMNSKNWQNLQWKFKGFRELNINQCVDVDAPHFQNNTFRICIHKNWEINSLFIMIASRQNQWKWKMEFSYSHFPFKI